MHTIIKAGLTAAFVAALAWPLLFWGKPALPEHGSRRPAIFSLQRAASARSGLVIAAVGLFGNHSDFCAPNSFQAGTGCEQAGTGCESLGFF